MSVITSQQLKMNRSQYQHKFKWAKQAISFKDKEKIEKLSKEIDQLVLDKSKNEKIGIQLRAMLLNEDGTFFINENGENLVSDVSQYIERNVDDSLLNGIELHAHIEKYETYVKSLKMKLKPELVYCYYALDLNKIEESHDVETFDDIRIPFNT